MSSRPTWRDLRDPSTTLGMTMGGGMTRKGSRDDRGGTRNDNGEKCHSGNRSMRSLFMVSMRASFLALDHFLSCFSLAMACSTSENDSKYTNLWHLYFCVKPGIVPDLCSATRLSISFVTPMYSVVSFLLERMYV